MLLAEPSLCRQRRSDDFAADDFELLIVERHLADGVVGVTVIAQFHSLSEPCGSSDVLSSRAPVTFSFTSLTKPIAGACAA
jgi:hypothetical protein